MELARASQARILARAIDREAFTVRYQPVLDLASGGWVGLEALARWEHPALGAIPPELFIPLAEQTGLVAALGELIAERAIGGLARLRVLLPGMRELTLSLNVSARQLAVGAEVEGLAGRLLRACERHGVEPTSLAVEIPEAALSAPSNSLREPVLGLCDLGLRPVIDGVGIEPAALGRLDWLAGAPLKIDRRFTAPLGHDPRAERVLGVVVALAQARGRTVTATGIESEAALEIVTRIGCERAQGSHLALPASIEELAVAWPALSSVSDAPPAASGVAARASRSSPDRATPEMPAGPLASDHR
jgi:EAL domain-containing protein (putative c-di-GMP-specific phosphodiesterase class I)